MPQQYHPSSAEKKEVVLYYVLIGLLVQSQQSLRSPYKTYHRQQAIGRRLCFCASLIIAMVLVWIPFIRLLVLLWILLMVGMWMYMVRQARVMSMVVVPNKLTAPLHAMGQRVQTVIATDDTSDQT